MQLIVLGDPDCSQEGEGRLIIDEDMRSGTDDELDGDELAHDPTRHHPAQLGDDALDHFHPRRDADEDADEDEAHDELDEEDALSDIPLFFGEESLSAEVGSTRVAPVLPGSGGESSGSAGASSTTTETTARPLLPALSSAPACVPSDNLVLTSDRRRSDRIRASLLLADSSADDNRSLDARINGSRGPRSRRASSLLRSPEVVGGGPLLAVGLSSLRSSVSSEVSRLRSVRASVELTAVLQSRDVIDALPLDGEEESPRAVDSFLNDSRFSEQTAGLEGSDSPRSPEGEEYAVTK